MPHGEHLNSGCAFSEFFIKWFCKCVHSLIFVVAKMQSLGTWCSLDVSLLLWYPVYFMITYSSILACYWVVLRHVGSDVL